MSSCCNDKACELDALRGKQTATLKAVLVINAVMFGVELTAGLAAGSVSLLADSLDMLGDALVYGVSIYAVTRGARERALSALLKGSVMALFGLLVVTQAVYRSFYPQPPELHLMGAIGSLALVANVVCLALLWRHRADDINMSSVWLCSRNDIVANVSVLLAAAAVWWLDSPWPDVVVGTGLAVLFLNSAVYVLREARSEFRVAHA